MDLSANIMVSPILLQTESLFSVLGPFMVAIVAHQGLASTAYASPLRRLTSMSMTIKMSTISTSHINPNKTARTFPIRITNIYAEPAFSRPIDVPEVLMSNEPSASLDISMNGDSYIPASKYGIHPNSLHATYQLWDPARRYMLP